MLRVFCVRNNLIITNTHFQHHKIKRFTWKAPDNIRKAQINYILVRERYKNQVKGSKNYPEADININHNLILMHYELQFKKLQKKQGMKRLQLANLKVEKIKNSYKEKTYKAMMEKFDTQSCSSIEKK